jgi:hypothetical protein
MNRLTFTLRKNILMGVRGLSVKFSLGAVRFWVQILVMSSIDELIKRDIDLLKV